MDKVKNIKLSPYHRFSWSIHNFLRKCLRFICFDVFDDDFRRSFGYWFLAVWLFGSFCCTVFSIFNNRNDLTAMLQLVGTSGAILQTSLKFSFVDDFKRLAFIPNFVQKIYEINSSNVKMANNEIFNICDKYSKLTKTVCWFMFCYVHVFIVFGSIQPILIYLFTGERVTSIGIDIPCINTNNTIEYLINVVFETSVLSIVCWIEVAVETVIIINFICLSMLSDIIKHHIDALQVDLNLKKLDAKTVEQKLVHIVLMHQKYIKWVHNIYVCKFLRMGLEGKPFPKKFTSRHFVKK